MPDPTDAGYSGFPHWSDIFYNNGFFNPITNEWFYTALSRVREFKDLSILKAEDNYDNLIMRHANNKILGYKKQDFEAGRIYNDKEFINSYWIIEQFKKQHGVCEACKSFINLLPDKTREGYTVDRYDNTKAHLKNNSCLLHLGCNCSKK